MSRYLKSMIRTILIAGIIWTGCNTTATAEAPVCDRVVPQKGCVIGVDYASGAAQDVAIIPSDKVNIRVVNKPPFTTCSIAATPSALTRDPSSSFTSFLTTVGTLGELGSTLSRGAGTVAARSNAPRRIPQLAAPALNPAKRDIDAIESQYVALVAEELRSMDYLKKVYQDPEGKSNDYVSVHRAITDLWKMKTDAEILGHLRAITDDLKALLNGPEPDIEMMQTAKAALLNSLKSFRAKHAPILADPEIAHWLDDIGSRVDQADGFAATVTDYQQQLIKMRIAFQQAYEEILSAGAGPFTTQDIHMGAFNNKQVSVSLTCKDDITDKAVNDSIIFTAYYAKLPMFDLSAGVILSSLGRYSIGVVSQTAAQAQAGTNANGTFGVTDQTKIQLIPMALVELHQRGFKCGDYVCDFGGVVGAGPNNVSGSTQAEFFEGISLAVQRLSFLLGFHDGRIEELGGGYHIGDPVPSSGYSPIVDRHWTARGAFGISYRIPLR